jgi:uncharacterized protein YdiU (UPF0061 family)
MPSAEGFSGLAPDERLVVSRLERQGVSMTTSGFEAHYAALPEHFHARVAPTPVAAPRLLQVNRELAQSLGLDPEWLTSDAGLGLLSGNALPGDLQPVAMAYAGHQFGNFVPQLGDGRAILLGERRDGSGQLFDVQLKGAGPTPFSRRGDGRSAIGPVLREYVVSEAMAGLGIPTTRSLAAVATGEPVYRESALPGAILTRVARGHLRVGTFEYFSRRGDVESVQTLVQYAIERLYPEASQAERPALEFFESVVRAQAQLVARWLGVGFVHGVMNTDNTSIAGETIDYGPCAFLDVYHPEKVFSSIDQAGRYAFGRQPGVAAWNLARLAETLLPLLGETREGQVEAAQRALDRFESLFQEAWHEQLRRKLGLARIDEEGLSLAASLLDAMAEQRADFTRTFRLLGERLEAEEPQLVMDDRDLPDSSSDVQAARSAGFADPGTFVAWADRWRARLALEARPTDVVRTEICSASPARIPRNHRIEEAIVAAMGGDLQPFERLLAGLASPYSDDPHYADLSLAPEPGEVVHQTFCGT